MLMMKLQWLIVLTLFVHNAWAYSLYDELDDDNLWRRETPSTENEGKPECKKDILVLWDNSNSISPHYEDVFKFMKKLIRNKDLNVGEDGTHLGFITFSDGQSLDLRRKERTKDKKNHTRVLLKVGEITDPEKIIDNLSGYDYDKDNKNQAVRTQLFH
ncbi:uncharacterized protein LOC114527004 [Dendronephthya gigantea]|uniref:uncharacterized protein LOC114527004 n=1 Tax=Dendronephthya gigantea TaxID=151771 RepID=UPI00106BCE4F|nr:uncharacterized protein LOC114527004 [Dendronephthya gigantea]